MTVFTNILSIITLIVVACALICGLWIHSNPIPDHGFHFVLSLSALVLSAAVIILRIRF